MVPGQWVTWVCCFGTYAVVLTTILIDMEALTVYPYGAYKINPGRDKLSL
jgi:hypothetical protein